MTTSATDKILDFAIFNEEQAAAFYMRLAEKVKGDNIKEALIGFAEEERGHKAKLEQIKAGHTLTLSTETVDNLGIAEQIDDKFVAVHDEMDYEQALIVAMKAEKAAYKLYVSLANECKDEGLKQVLLGLANEEAKHKLRFEMEYDEHVLKEN